MPAAEDGGSARHRIFHHDPRHVGLRFELEPHAGHIAARPLARLLLLDRRHGCALIR